MKYLVTILLSSVLVLSACGNNQEAEHKDKKENKQAKEKKADKEKEDKNKQEEQAKKESESKEQNEDASETAQTQENEQQVEQQQSQENQVNQQQQNQQANQAPPQQEPSYEEQMRANAEVAKQHGYTGIPNGDAGMIDYEEVERILEENRNVDEDEVGEMITPEEEEEAIMEQHESELDQ
ncbi:hypothetical protein K2V61_04575 [Staphylococcus simulans]|uniref:hypothetical protein n=1 Tax=Staphylococcus simulans TaxID=1286 RepID=UPI001E606A21|nr:hypothetical protein [Staphylococcus simulans]MCD8914810.1 hypothetical protein [Staphylococcus simulans]